MKQLVKNNKTGKVSVENVPSPALLEGQVLVKNHYSVISLGTELASVKVAEKNLLSKAISRPEDFKKFLNLAHKEGYLTAFKKAINRLEIPAPLGYSCAGKVVEVSSSIKSLQVGDFVACGGGGYASHSEFITVPVNLCRKVSSGIDLKYASFTTLGAIALQGIRQTECKIGENVIVLGLGLIGQLTIKLLKLSGCFPIGIDIDYEKINYTKNMENIPCFTPDDANLLEKIKSKTQDFGADSVIITASSNSEDVFEKCIDYIRDRGTISLVGNIPIKSTWKKAYEKEINIVLSRSYGPGRYDKNYEEKGIDYPINYVRWTENRNMAAFVRFLEEEKLDISKLITSEINFDKSVSVYKGKKQDFNLGVLISYDESAGKISSISNDRILNVSNNSNINVSLIGGGSFAQNNILPHLKKNSSINLLRICSNSGITSKHVMDKFGFDFSTTDSKEIFADKDNDCVFITTRHDSHGPYVIEAMKKNLDIFVEKPLTIHRDDITEIKSLMKNFSKRIMVGYNRRFSKPIQLSKNYIKDFSAALITYDIYAGSLPKDHWFYDEKQGGSRILSEPIHFLDVCNYLLSSYPKDYNISVLRTEQEADKGVESFSLNLTYENGSLANINYICNSSTNVPKETISVNFSGNTIIINDFKSCVLNNKKTLWSSRTQDKGFSFELESFIAAIKENNPSPIDINDIINSTELMIDINDKVNQSV